MYGGKQRHAKKHYKERMPLLVSEADNPVLGGRKKTRRTKWRYIRGMKIRKTVKRQRRR